MWIGVVEKIYQAGDGDSERVSKGGKQVVSGQINERDLGMEPRVRRVSEKADRVKERDVVRPAGYMCALLWSRSELPSFAYARPSPQ